MNDAQTKPTSVKWWQVCIAVVGLIVLVTVVGRNAFTPKQTYSQKMTAGTTPVVED